MEIKYLVTALNTVALVVSELERSVSVPLCVAWHRPSLKEAPTYLGT